MQKFIFYSDKTTKIDPISLFFPQNQLYGDLK